MPDNDGEGQSPDGEPPDGASLEQVTLAADAEQVTVAADASPAVTALDHTSAAAVDLRRWAEVARDALVGESVDAGQLDLIFVDVDEMAELNLTHMGHEGPTDVLSFPLDGDDDFPNLPASDPDSDSDSESEMGGGAGPVPIHLGDVVVCPEVARRQAPDHCGTVDGELALLIIHGVLHILGHDHREPSETTAMQARERHHLAALGLPHPVSA